MGCWYREVVVLGFTKYNVGEMDFPSPAAISERRVNFRKVRYLFSSVGYSPCITPLRKSSIIREYFWHWGLRFVVFYSIPMFLKRNLHVLGIHYLVVHLVSAVILLDNRDPKQPMPSLWASMDSLR